MLKNRAPDPAFKAHLTLLLRRTTHFRHHNSPGQCAGAFQAHLTSLFRRT